MRPPTVFCLLSCLILAGCGGMNRAVGVLPNTLDDLGQKSAPLRGERPAEGAGAAR